MTCIHAITAEFQTLTGMVSLLDFELQETSKVSVLYFSAYRQQLLMQAENYIHLPLLFPFSQSALCLQLSLQLLTSLLNGASLMQSVLHAPTGATASLHKECDS